MNRAYSVLHIKAVQEDQRIITGIATTPSVDRMGDVVEPLGVQFTNPLSLLHQHDSTCPVGTVTFDPPTKDGITFKATLPTIAEPGPLKDRVDTAWGEVKAGLVRAVSIGFRPIEYSFIENGGIRFTEIEVFELSLVSVPAQADAVISTIKSIDAPLLVAAGKQPKASDRPQNKSTDNYHVGAAKALPIDTSTAWDGPAAAERMLADAGFNGDNPDTAKARRGFLCYDASAPTLKGSYKLPFADIVGGELKAVEGGLHAAASRLPQTDIPKNVQDDARTVLDGYFSRLNDDGSKSQAASGHKVVKLTPGVTGSKSAAAARVVPASKTNPVTLKGIMAKKSISEQIAAFKETRVAKSARLDEIMDEAGEKGETLDAAGKEEYDGLAAELKEIDEHLARLEVRQKSAVASATAVAGESADAAAAARNTVHASVKAAPKVAPGIRFARLARIKGLSKIEQRDALGLAEQLYGQRDPVIVDVVKASVTGGSSASGNWGENLVGTETSVFADFAEFLRPQTILGKFGVGGVPALRRVPFRVALIGQTAGGSGYWVGAGQGKPLTALDFSRTTLAPLKVANIAVATMELLRDSSPSAEGILRDQLAAALRSRLDTDFIDPAKAASAGVSPASITNGVSAIHSTGNTADDVRADFRALMATFVAANNPPSSGVWIMNSTTALALSLMVNALGQAEFPGITMNGGIFLGIPTIVSEFVPSVSAGSYVILANASDIYEADDGDVAVDMSTEASLEMSDSPTGSSTTPTAASLVSLWQTNSVGFRAERTINWARRRDSAVAVLDQVNWGAGS